jgi:hypothetical protein
MHEHMTKEKLKTSNINRLYYVSEVKSKHPTHHRHTTHDIPV